MLGISEIGHYIPEGRISNFNKKEQFKISDDFIKEKLGVYETSQKAPDEKTSDLCIEAFKALNKKISIDKDKIEALIVVTQNPDVSIPHCSAIVQGKLGITKNCACFDISLGCSGFVYALSVMESFMKYNNMKYGLLFTADPYSEIVDQNDKNTSMLFGDAGAVTLISENIRFQTLDFTFGTIGEEYSNLTLRCGKLYMNGRSIFNFAAKTVPVDVEKLLQKNSLSKEEIDKFVFHPGSKVIVNKLRQKLGIPEEKVLFDIYHYGNTVSSSIPILLEKILHDKHVKHVVISGFGVGLSWSSALLKRNI